MLQADTSDVLPPSGWFCHIYTPPRNGTRPRVLIMVNMHLDYGKV